MWQDWRFRKGLLIASLVIIWFGNIFSITGTYAQFEGLVQERRNSSVFAMELRLSCINPSSCLPATCEQNCAFYASAGMQMSNDYMLFILCFIVSYSSNMTPVHHNYALIIICKLHALLCLLPVISINTYLLLFALPSCSVSKHWLTYTNVTLSAMHITGHCHYHTKSLHQILKKDTT